MTQQRRVAALEVRLTPAPAPHDLEALLPWVAWLSDAHLDELEELFRRAAEAGIDELPKVEQLRVTEIAAASQRRMLLGEPPVCP